MATEASYTIRSLRKLDALVAEHVIKKTGVVPAYTTWAGVEAVVKNREQAGFHWLVKSPFQDGEPYWAGLTPKGVSGWNGKPDFYQSGSAEPIARCLAALASEGVQVNTELGGTPI